MIVRKCFSVITLVFALSACVAGPQNTSAVSSDGVVTEAGRTAAVVSPTGSDFDQMRNALPDFSLRLVTNQVGQRREISVARDIVFPPGNTFLSRDEVRRLAPLLVYLRAHPAVAVRIEGYGDEPPARERDRELSSARADAVARALLVDMRIANAIVARPAVKPVGSLLAQAEITFILPE